VNREPNHIPRSIRLADVMVVIAGFFHNIMTALHVLSDEILELVTYNAIRKNEVNQAWEQFTQDLEKMEDGNG
jgi:hypothetical protein